MGNGNGCSSTVTRPQERHVKRAACGFFVKMLLIFGISVGLFIWMWNGMRIRTHAAASIKKYRLFKC